MSLNQNQKYQILIERASPSLNDFIYNREPFTHQKEKKAWYWLVRCAKGFLDVPRATGKRHVHIQRAGKRPVDLDNLIGGAKLCIVDNLKKWKLLIDDDQKNMTISCENIPLKPGEKPHTIVILEDI